MLNIFFKYSIFFIYYKLETCMDVSELWLAKLECWVQRSNRNQVLGDPPSFVYMERKDSWWHHVDIFDHLSSVKIPCDGHFLKNKTKKKKRLWCTDQRSFCSLLEFQNPLADSLLKTHSSAALDLTLNETPNQHPGAQLLWPQLIHFHVFWAASEQLTTPGQSASNTLMKILGVGVGWGWGWG